MVGLVGARLVSAWVLRRWFCCGLAVLVFVIIIDDVVACCVLILVGCYGGWCMLLFCLVVFGDLCVVAY